MQKIDIVKIRGWTRSGKSVCPGAVSTMCPYCSEMVIFTITDRYFDQPRSATSGSGKCPSCSEKVGIWSVANDSSALPADVYLHPTSTIYREAIHADVDLPEQLKRAYLSTISSFNSRNYPATALGCRRTLEGIFKFLVPESQRDQNLARLITESASHVDFSRPIHELSDLIRKGGNVGAHFDMQKEPDERMAQAMVELLEDLVSYLYVLPNKISNLEEELDRDS